MDKQKEYYDRTAKKHPSLKEGSTVRVNKDGSWPVKARVIERDQHPRSSKIQIEEGRVLRQNRRDLLQTNEPFIQANAEIEVPLAECHNTEKEILKE